MVALGQWNHDQYLNNVGIIEIVDLINPNSKWNGPIEGLIENQPIIYSGYFHNFDKMIQNYDFDRWESSDFVKGTNLKIQSSQNSSYLFNGQKWVGTKGIVSLELV